MIGGDFDTPVMYQDLANYSMPPMQMGMPFGGMVGGNTSYLGGVQLKRQLDHDKVQLINKKNEEAKSTLKKALIGIGVCLAIGFIPVICKNVKNAGGVWQYIKGLFTKTPPAPPSTPKPSLWQRFKNIFTRSSAPAGGTP